MPCLKSIVVISSLFGLFVSASEGCPIKLEINSKITALDNDRLLSLSPDWSEPEQTAGVTITDFGSIRPWKVTQSQGQYIALVDQKTLMSTVYLRPQKLKNGKPNPRWLSPKDYPCGNEPDKNFVTYECTLEHEKVHLVQREEALKEKCQEYVTDIEKIRANSEEEANKQASDAYRKLLIHIAKKDGEGIPYKIEWDCNRKLAEKAGLTCKGATDFNVLPFLKKYSAVKKNEQELLFKENNKVLFEAKILKDIAKIQSTGKFEGCQKKEWYLIAGNLSQVNCYNKNGVEKVMYEYGKKQKMMLVSPDGKKLKEKIYIDSRARILKD